MYFEIKHDGQTYLLSGSFRSLKKKSSNKKVWCFGADGLEQDGSSSDTDLPLPLKTKLMTYGVIASALLSTQIQINEPKVDLGMAHVMTVTVVQKNDSSNIRRSLINPSMVGEG